MDPTKTPLQAQRLSSDMITTLPRTIIETILCLLPLEEAARTSILSREWRYKWTTIPTLEFHEYENDDKPFETTENKFMDLRRKLFDTIHQVLLLRQGQINEFTLCMYAYDIDTCFQIDQILLHLSRNHCVKKLTLNFIVECSFRRYTLPFSLFSFHHLTDLHLQCGMFNHKPVFNGFSSLTKLTLDNIYITRESLLHLLSKCPSLKSFSLCNNNENPNIMELFKCLPMIEHLTICGDQTIQRLVSAPVSEKLTAASLFHLKYFCMEDMSMYGDLSELTFLLVLIKCSPNLEIIKLEADIFGYIKKSIKIEEYTSILKEYSDVRLEHLKELKFRCFRNFKHELELVKFILARSPKLKKVILITNLRDKRELKLLRVLIRAPRVSPAEIIVKNHHKKT